VTRDLSLLLIPCSTFKQLSMCYMCNVSQCMPYCFILPCVRSPINTTTIPYNTIDDLHWKTDRQAASLI